MPVCDASSGEWSIVNKQTLLCASIILQDGRLPIDAAPDEEALYDRQVQLEVYFVQGEMLVGKILYSPPEGKARVTDHMNRRGAFFRLWTGDRLYLVNKSKVLRLVEIAESE